MRTRPFVFAPLFVIVATVAFPQQQQPRYLLPIANESQFLRGSAAATEGAIGLFTEKSNHGFLVTNLIAGGPSDRSGIRVGDLITVVDGESAVGISELQFMRLLKKHPGESVQFDLTRNNARQRVIVTAEPRGKLPLSEASAAPGVSQLIFGEHAAVTAPFFNPLHNWSRFG